MLVPLTASKQLSLSEGSMAEVAEVLSWVSAQFVWVSECVYASSSEYQLVAASLISPAALPETYSRDTLIGSLNPLQPRAI